jgi:hypothetical protein
VQQGCKFGIHERRGKTINSSEETHKESLSWVPSQRAIKPVGNVASFSQLLQIGHCQRAKAKMSRLFKPEKEIMSRSQSQWIGFVGKIYRKPWFLPSNIGVSCKFSHHPILWQSCWFTTGIILCGTGADSRLCWVSRLMKTSSSARWRPALISFSPITRVITKHASSGSRVGLFGTNPTGETMVKTSCRNSNVSEVLSCFDVPVA